MHSAPAQAKAEKSVRASRIEVSQEVDECAFFGGRGEGGEKHLPRSSLTARRRARIDGQGGKRIGAAAAQRLFELRL